MAGHFGRLEAAWLYTALRCCALSCRATIAIEKLTAGCQKQDRTETDSVSPVCVHTLQAFHA